MQLTTALLDPGAAAMVVNAGVLDWVETKSSEADTVMKSVITFLAILFAVISWIKAGRTFAALLIAGFVAAVAIFIVQQITWLSDTVETEITGAPAPPSAVHVVDDPPTLPG